jgi:ankyrin repeat protein
VDVKIDGHSALHYAAWMNDESICQLLINAGAPVNVSTSGRDRRTPLDEAIIKGNESLCKMLIDARADVNILVSENRTTPLMYSMYQSNERVCALLLEAKANVNMQASEHRTALYIAITQKDVGKCAMLIAAGADVNMKNCINSSGRAHLMDAVREGNEQMCALLLEKQADINIQDRRTNKSALSAAILQKNSGMCALLIAAGADIHAQDWCDRTAFMQSVMKGNEQICALLLAAKADLNASGGYGVPPLHGAIFLKDNAISMVRFLLEAGADLPCVYSGQRVLIRAAQFQKDSLCRLIVEHQKSRNARAAQALLFRLKRMKAEGHAAARFLYKHSHQLLQPYLKDMALRAMLAARDLHGKRAFDYLPIDVLAVEENK